jgi:hypothetical protein
MTRIVSTKTSFTAGELDPSLWGRIDLRALEEGARRLRNVIVHPTGGVARRPGTQLLLEIAGARRLIDFDTGAGSALAVLGDRILHVVEGDALAPGAIPCPWTAAKAQAVDWAPYRDGLFICHPAYPPQIPSYTDGAWSLGEFAFDEVPLPAGTTRSQVPFVRFAPAEVSLQVEHGTQALSQPIAADRPVVVRTSAPVFLDGHQFARLRVNGREILLQDITSPTTALGVTQDELASGEPTRDWQEQAFSEARGYPATMTFHQDRLVIGGSRDLPDRLWFSQTGRPRNFDPGTGLDDEAISFRLTSDRVHEIVGVIEGHQLQVFTTAGEWVIKGYPLTPRTVQAELQTRNGSRREPRVPPVNVDGATLFVGAGGRELREFIYSDTEQAYQAADLAMLSRHLIREPVDLTFDDRRRLLCIVNADGAVATVSIDRNSNVVAWSSQSFAGQARSAAMHAGALYLLVEVDGRVFLERVDDGLAIDHAVVRSEAMPTSSFPGLDSLVGKSVVIIADGSIVFEGLLASPTFELPAPARSLACGMRFLHEVEPPPPAAATRNGPTLASLYRLVRATFRMLETGALRVDLGNGWRQPILQDGHAVPFTGDLVLGAVGWRRSFDGAPWRIAQDDPLPFTLLAVTTDIKVND